MPTDECQRDAPACVRCGKPVVVERARYEIFERMHWICFHMEFEHLAEDPALFCDPDEECMDPSCPWRFRERMTRYDAKLRELGVDPDSL